MATSILRTGVCSTALKGASKNVCCQVIWNANDQQNRSIQKHWNPKFKWLRTKKFMKVDLPNYQEKNEDLTQEEQKRRLKERGVTFARPWNERPILLAATIGIFEAYVPPEGDGKMSKLSLDGQKQTVDFLSKKTKSMLAIRKIRQYDEDFSANAFAETAQNIYVQAHEALVAKDKGKLIENVTEHLYPRMLTGAQNVTLRWRFIKSIEPPRTVHARQTHLIVKDNIFAQVTVRMHTQQSLAVYDRFGRLKHGSEILAKDVIEYVVFEKNISNLYGEWRMHEKIVPPWTAPKQVSPVTYRFVPPVEEEPAKEASNQEKSIETVQIEDTKTTPPLVTA